jgi:hypothetical protein
LKVYENASTFKDWVGEGYCCYFEDLKYLKSFLKIEIQGNFSCPLDRPGEGGDSWI